MIMPWVLARTPSRVCSVAIRALLPRLQAILGGCYTNQLRPRPSSSDHLLSAYESIPDRWQQCLVRCCGRTSAAHVSMVLQHQYAAGWGDECFAGIDQPAIRPSRDVFCGDL